MVIRHGLAMFPYPVAAASLAVCSSNQVRNRAIFGSSAVASILSLLSEILLSGVGRIADVKRNAHLRGLATYIDYSRPCGESRLTGHCGPHW